MPKEYRFADDEVFVRKIGESVLLFPKNKDWETFLEGLNGFTDDYFEAMSERINEPPQERYLL